MFRLAILSLALGCTASIAAAHEFWLSPEAYRVMPGDPMEVRLRVGEAFRGPSYVYNPARFARFGIVSASGERAVEGRIGDDPALVAQARAPGLAVIIHETTEQTLTYREWERFVSFVAHKGHGEAVERHRARDLPETGFREKYRRFAKALLAVGPGEGVDAPQGLLTELVALANPYTDDLSAGLPVRVLYEGHPRPGAQLELFSRAPDGTIEVTIHIADAGGEARLPMRAGHEYLVDSVVLLEVTPEEEGDPVWESLWASLTFRVPD